MKEKEIKVYLNEKFKKEKFQRLVEKFQKFISQDISILYYLIAKILEEKNIFEKAGCYTIEDKTYLVYFHKRTKNRFIVEKKFLSEEKERIKKKKLLNFLEEESLEVY
jgi:hypothetical protein